MNENIELKNKEMDKTKQQQQPSSFVLSRDLNQHYIAHGVVGIEEFITQGGTTATTSRSSNHHPSHAQQREENVTGSSRFIRLNPRFNQSETLRLLTVSFYFF